MKVRIIEVYPIFDIYCEEQEDYVSFDLQQIKPNEFLMLSRKEFKLIDNYIQQTMEEHHEGDYLVSFEMCDDNYVFDFKAVCDKSVEEEFHQEILDGLSGDYERIDPLNCWAKKKYHFQSRKFWYTFVREINYNII